MAAAVVERAMQVYTSYTVPMAATFRWLCLIDVTSRTTSGLTLDGHCSDVFCYFNSQSFLNIMKLRSSNGYWLHAKRLRLFVFL